MLQPPITLHDANWSSRLVSVRLLIFPVKGGCRILIKYGTVTQLKHLLLFFVEFTHIFSTVKPYQLCRYHLYFRSMCCCLDWSIRLFSRMPLYIFSFVHHTVKMSPQIIKYLRYPFISGISCVCFAFFVRFHCLLLCIKISNYN